MHTNYADITSRISDPIKWWDENAVPRYCNFAPGDIANIYANECCLLLIECQNCAERFEVCISVDTMDIFRWYEPQRIDTGDSEKNEENWKEFRKQNSLSARIKRGMIHYGDPPNNNCCGAGPTMNSIPIRVLQYWHRNQFNWQRDSEFEIIVDEELVISGKETIDEGS